jgi:hypothetical protein
VKEDKTMASQGSVGGAVWGSLMNAANKVTDTINSLTTQNNPQITINRPVSTVPPDESNTNNLNRPRSQTLPATPTSPLQVDEGYDEPKQMAIDTLGQGELSLKELGFDSDMPRTSGESSARSVQDEISEGGREENGFSSKHNADLLVPVEHKKTESIGRSRRSLTVPTRSEVPTGVDRRLAASSPKKPRRLSSLSKKNNIRNQSVASRASSDAPTPDDASRRTRKRSSLSNADGLLDSPKPRTAGTPDTSEDRENEDGLYIHEKDGKKRRVPITGFAVQSGKRNRDFHALFKSVEESDYLIEGIDYVESLIQTIPAHCRKKFWCKAECTSPSIIFVSIATSSVGSQTYFPLHH